MQVSRRICKYDFTIAAGAATTNVNLNPDDLSHAQELLIELKLSTIGTDAGDTLDFKLQETNDGTAWNTRARFPAVAGNTSAATPRVYRMALANSHVTLQAGEKSYEVSGDAGATEIAAGTVLQGPFPGVRRTAAGRQPSWRLSFVTVDANSNATWIGTVTVWAVSEIDA